MKRNLTVSRKFETSKRKEFWNPYIRLSGKWLSAFCEPGDKIQVTQSNGKLTISKFKTQC